MKRYTLLMLLICVVAISSEQNRLDFFYSNKVDSVVVCTFYHWDKEMSAVGDTSEAIIDKVTGNAKLSIDEIKELNDLILTKPSQLNGGVALYNHADTKFIYYKEGKPFQYIIISSMTGRVSIIRDDCKQLKDGDYSCIFYGGARSKFKTFILILMKKKGLWDKDAKFGFSK